MTQWRADKGAVCGHLGYSRGEVVAVLVTVFGEPRSEEFLETGESTRREHLRAQRVLLELIDVRL